MLTAILHGKAAKVAADGEDISWRQLFRQREDLMTAAFFGRFSYFSAPMRLEAIALLIGLHEAKKLGDIEQVVFWPSFWLNKHDGGGRVEPDVIIKCENGVVLIEIKPPWAQQIEDQWSREVYALDKAVRSNSGIDFKLTKLIHFVALGGNRNKNLKENFEKFASEKMANEGIEYTFHQKEWEDILKGIDGWSKLEKEDRAIVNDWRSGFDLFGLQRPIKPFADLCNLRVEEKYISLLARIHSAPSEVEQQSGALPSSLLWRPLLSVFLENPLEDVRCLSLLKKLANS